jgi:hypothetical protein
VLTRSFYIVLDLIHAQEEYAKLKGSVAAGSRTNGAAGASPDAQKTIADLQARLKAAEAKERDFGEPPVRNRVRRADGVDGRDAQEAERAAGGRVRPPRDPVQRVDGPGVEQAQGLSRTHSNKCNTRHEPVRNMYKRLQKIRTTIR